MRFRALPPTPGALVLATALFALSVRERVPERQLVERLRQGDRRLHSELRLCLAWALRHLLGNVTDERAAVHVVGSTLTDEARPSSDLDLIVEVPDLSPEGASALEELNADITRAYAELMTNLGESFRLLDVHVVTSREEAQGMGFAPLLRGSSAARYAIPLF